MSPSRGKVALGVHSEVRVVSFIREEQRDSYSSTGGVIVRELCQRQEIGPVVLLVVAVNPKVLLQGLIGLLCLSVTFGMVAQCEMELHVEHGPEQAEEVQDEFHQEIVEVMICLDKLDQVM